MTNEEMKFLEICKNNGITDKLELAHIFAQCSHESAGFTIFNENLNYSAKALCDLFPKYFNSESANLCGRTDKNKANQEMIANTIYGNRMGNTQNEGYKYRGRGVIQITGKNNYNTFSKWLNKEEILNNPDVVSTDAYKYLTAIWFWKTNNLKQYALQDDISTITRKINGGTFGLKERIELLAKYKKIFN